MFNKEWAFILREVWLPQNQLQKLQRIQNSAARIITRTKTRHHITPVLMDLHWLPIVQRIKFKIALLVFKCIHDTAPNYLCELLNHATTSRTLRSSHQHHLLHVERFINSFDDRAFQKHAPVIWNALPDSVRTITSMTIFKSRLKTVLFIEAFNWLVHNCLTSFYQFYSHVLYCF